MLKKVLVFSLLLLSFSFLLNVHESKVFAAPVVKVGTDATYAPFGFQDANSGEVVGFDIDLIRAIGQRAGFEVQIENLNFDGLIPALLSGNLDIAISDMSITAERAKVFCQRYYKCCEAV